MPGAERVKQLDVELALYARELGGLQLRLAEALELLACAQGYHAQGFSDLGAYVRERCERSERWASQARTLARRLSALPLVRAALCRGEIQWSQAELLARYATAESEQQLLELARSSTVRELRVACRERDAQSGERTAEPANITPSEGRDANRESSSDASSEGESDRLQASSEPDEAAWSALVLTLDQEDAWLLQCTRWLARALGTKTDEEFVTALTGEGWTSFAEWTEANGHDLTRWYEEWEEALAEKRAQQDYNEQRQRWREEAERLCEANFRSAVDGKVKEALRGAVRGEVKGAGETSTLQEASAAELDARIRKLASVMAERDLRVGSLLLEFHAVDGWLQLGFASWTHYAKERLGMSYSRVKERMALARRALRFPAIAEAMRAQRIGFDAANLVARVATADTVQAWIARASERTVKHLREEIEAAELLQRLALAQNVQPPSDRQMAELAALKGNVLAGGPSGSIIAFAQGQLVEQLEQWAKRWLERQRRGAGTELAGSEIAGAHGRMSAGPSTAGANGRMSAGSVAAGGDGRMSAGWRAAGIGPGNAETDDEDDLCSPAKVIQLRSRGRCRLRLRVHAETARFYRCFERELRRHAPRGLSFMRYLCLTFWQSWWQTAGKSVAYEHIYQRDAYQCASPVCTRHDVTPHHLEFRSRGGGEEPENLLSLCVWCHLHGVHEGRLKVTPPASAPEWAIGMTDPSGRDARLRVRGRRRLAA